MARKNPLPSDKPMTVADLKKLANAEEIVKFPLRMPNDIYRKVRFLAAHNGITVREFLCNMIEEAYDHSYAQIVENIVNLKPKPKEETTDGNELTEGN